MDHNNIPGMGVEKPRILICGMQKSDNQFTRAVFRYGFIPIHVHGGKTSDTQNGLPKADGAIFITSVNSHKAYHNVKEHLKKEGLPIWYASHGFSEIKEEFENYWIKPYKELLEPHSWRIRLHVLAAFFVRKIGVKFTRGELTHRIQQVFYSDLQQNNLNAWIIDAIQCGVIDRVEETRGMYVFNGLDGVVRELKRRDLPIIGELAETSKSKEKEDETEKLQKEAEIQKQALEAAEKKVAEAEEESKKQADNLEALVDGMATLEKSQQKLHHQVGDLVSRMHRVVAAADPSGRQALIDELVTLATGLSGDELTRMLATNRMIWGHKQA